MFSGNLNAYFIGNVNVNVLHHKTNYPEFLPTDMGHNCVTCLYLFCISIYICFFNDSIGSVPRDSPESWKSFYFRRKTNNWHHNHCISLGKRLFGTTRNRPMPLGNNQGPSFFEFLSLLNICFTFTLAFVSSSSLVSCVPSDFIRNQSNGRHNPCIS